MAVSYKKLWKLLIDKNMKKKDLRAASGISTTTLAKLGKDENVSTEILSKICAALNCDVGDIMEMVPDDSKDVESMNGNDTKQTRSFLNMNQSTYNALKSFIWGIANDCLVDVYDVGDYRKVILPMLVIRRFDAVLEPKHDEVVAAKKKFEKDGVTVDIDPALCGIAGQAFVNKSDFTLRDLKSRTNQQQLRKDFIDYLDGFSKNVQEIINKFHFRDQIPRLSEQDRLGLLIEKFVDPSINLSNKPVLNEDGSEKLEALDNHTMGTLFEEVIRMFNEQTNVTDAGRHFTPRDIIELMADLAFIPIQDKIQSTTYRIY